MCGNNFPDKNIPTFWQTKTHLRTKNKLPFHTPTQRRHDHVFSTTLTHQQGSTTDDLEATLDWGHTTDLGSTSGLRHTDDLELTLRLGITDVSDTHRLGPLTTTHRLTMTLARPWPMTLTHWTTMHTTRCQDCNTRRLPRTLGELTQLAEQPLHLQAIAWRSGRN